MTYVKIGPDLGRKRMGLGPFRLIWATGPISPEVRPSLNQLGVFRRNLETFGPNLDPCEPIPPGSLPKGPRLALSCQLSGTLLNGTLLQGNKASLAA